MWITYILNIYVQVYKEYICTYNPLHFFSLRLSPTDYLECYLKTFFIDFLYWFVVGLHYDLIWNFKGAVFKSLPSSDTSCDFKGSQEHP